MHNTSTAGDRHTDRRLVLKAGAALAAAGPAALRGGHAEAQPRTNRETVLVAYVGAFTTPERKGHGGGINVYRVNPTSGAWTHEQLFEIANPSFLTLDPAQRFLYSVHADLDEVSAYAIDKQNGHIAALNRQSCGGKNPVHLSIDPTGRWIVTANYSWVGRRPTRSPRAFFASIQQTRSSMQPTPTRASATSRTPTRSCRSGSTKQMEC